MQKPGSIDRAFSVCSAMNTLVQLLVLLLLPAMSLAQQDVDVLHYEADITMRRPETRYVNGVVDVHVRWRSTSEHRTLVLHARGIAIDSAHRRGTMLRITRNTTHDPDAFHVRINQQGTTPLNSIDTIRVWFSGTMIDEGGPEPWGGVWYEDSILYALGVGFGNASVSATRHWLPCFDHPSDKATFRGTFRIPEAFTCASVGQVEHDSVSGADQLRAITWYESHPTATYALTFAVGPYQKLDLTNRAISPIPHHVYSRVADTLASLAAYALTPAMTQLYEGLFGDYPFHKVGYVNTTRGAMEHQTMISMPVSIVRKADSTHSTIAHELVHQWFGDYVTPHDFGHAWLTEAFATYGESAWIEHRLGWEAYLESIDQSTQRYLQTIAPEEGVLPLVGYPRDEPSSNYPGTIYQKGRVVVAMMRALAGDSAFYHGLRTYLTRNAYGTATTSDLREALRPALGKHTDAFFEEWVMARGWPVIKVSFEEHSDATYVVLQQVQPDLHGWPVFTTIPLDVIYTAADGQSVNMLLVMTDHSLRIPVGSMNGFAINAGKWARSLLEIHGP